MIIRSLKNLPHSPHDYTGWPWDTECNPVLGAEALPKITVVTPSFNQGRFLEKTIRSVLLQGYPNLQYIVIDGGSTDESVEILKTYSPYLDFWVSEKDVGQSHAINKGFSRASGEIFCWLNSDDIFMPGALYIVGKLLEKRTGNFALVGNCIRTHENGSPAIRLYGQYIDRLRLLQFWKGYQMHQPAIFWRCEVTQRVGMLNESLHLTMDYDYWTRIAKHFDFAKVDQDLACSHYHAAAKTGDNYVAYREELRRYSRRYWGPLWSSEYWKLSVSMWRHFFLDPSLKRFCSLSNAVKDSLRIRK